MTDAHGSIPPKAAGKQDQVGNPLDFVLDRELCEVHLLLDFISSAADRTLPQVLPFDPVTAATPSINLNWLERLCQINWPPTAPNLTRYAQAALLVRAKDALNRVAQPASGSTIAFTLLVAQEDNSVHEVTEPGSAATRTSLARTAFPGLISKAKTFRLGNTLILLGLFIWLLLTCAVSWYVAVGNLHLAQFSDAKKAEIAVLQNIGNEESGRTDRTNTPKNTSDDRRAASTPANTIGADGATPDANKDPRILAFCDRSKTLDAVKIPNNMVVSQYSSVSNYQLCSDQFSTMSELLNTARELRRWRHFFTKITDVPFATDPLNANVWADAAFASASAWAGLLGTSVLPILYGALGAGASVVRSISRKTSASLLSPRDLPLSLQQLALGAVVGACIGLFVNGPNVSTAGAALMGPVALSSSALSFIAGFGVEGVFRAMEGLINRIFGGGAGQASTPPSFTNQSARLPS